MNLKINLKPYPAAPYFTVQEHLRTYSGDLNIYDHYRNVEKKLRSITGLSSDYHFNLMKPSESQAHVTGSYIITKQDNPISGVSYIGNAKDDSSGKGTFDLSYSFPHIIGPFDGFDTIIIDPKASLGIPVAFIVVFSISLTENRSKSQKIDLDNYLGKDLYLFSSVLDDLSNKGSDVLIRESNYKAAVLYQLIDSNKNFSAVAKREDRSKTMVVAEVPMDIVHQIFQMGYEVYVHENTLSKITIANYPTHSKELIEMFVDRVNAL